MSLMSFFKLFTVCFSSLLRMFSILLRINARLDCRAEKLLILRFSNIPLFRSNCSCFLLRRWVIYRKLEYLKTYFQLFRTVNRFLVQLFLLTLFVLILKQCRLLTKTNICTLGRRFANLLELDHYKGVTRTEVLQVILVGTTSF